MLPPSILTPFEEALEVKDTVCREVALWLQQRVMGSVSIPGAPRVCPGLPQSVNVNGLWLGKIELTGVPLTDLGRVSDWRGRFIETEPTRPPASLYKSILLIVTGYTDRFYLQQLKNVAKPYFVREGMMLGTFNPQESGARFDEVRQWPPRSPVGVLAIREMIRSDDRFLARDPELLELHRRKFLAGAD